MNVPPDSCMQSMEPIPIPRRPFEPEQGCSGHHHAGRLAVEAADARQRKQHFQEARGSKASLWEIGGATRDFQASVWVFVGARPEDLKAFFFWGGLFVQMDTWCQRSESL